MSCIPGPPFCQHWADGEACPRGDTLPPPPAEAAALAAFEGAIRREGEPRARLRHMASHASATLRGVTLPPAIVMGVRMARK